MRHKCISNEVIKNVWEASRMGEEGTQKEYSQTRRSSLHDHILLIACCRHPGKVSYPPKAPLDKMITNILGIYEV